MYYEIKKNAINALLDEYKRAIKDLQEIIKDISDADLIKPIGSAMDNPECNSIQGILTHVISSGYSYCVYIQNIKDPTVQRPESKLQVEAAKYIEDLNAVHSFTQSTFATISDDDLEEHDFHKMIHTRWGQYYDIEQLFEHAIVHVLRHRRQIEGILRQSALSQP